jgi:purine-binding chemotaxis protein CheW
MTEVAVLQPVGVHAPAGGEFLTFTLGAEEYGIDILKVQEIRGYDAVTRIASAPAFVKGVINLRGVIVPVVDLRIRFGLGAAEYNAFTVVIILNVGGRVVGVVVDTVSDVLRLDDEQIKPAPAMPAAIDGACILGIGTVEQRMLILLDIQRLLLAPEMGLVESPLH